MEILRRLHRDKTEMMSDEVTQERKRRKLERKPADTLFVSDAELIRRSGVPERTMYQALKMLDKNPSVSKFPQKQAIFGNKRYWPAVKAYLDRASGLNVEAPKPKDRRYG